MFPGKLWFHQLDAIGRVLDGFWQYGQSTNHIYIYLFPIHDSKEKRKRIYLYIIHMFIKQMICQKIEREEKKPEKISVRK
jgi:hypothetical protein